MTYKDQIDMSRLPGHVAVIMDGNGRWAHRRGRERVFGHHEGVKAVRKTVEASAELGVRYLTLYAFSTENWNRPDDEVSALMDLMIESINNETGTLVEKSISLRVIGDLSRLSEKVRNRLFETMKITSQGSRMTLVVALSYSSRWEISEACRRIAVEVREGRMRPDQIDEHTVSTFLTTSDIPDPELMIRTSGEKRISNFLLWQLAYTELYFTEKLWPDFGKEDFYKAVADFQKRERRYGKTSEQIAENS
ncbi:MAG TPA: isoprenyl transferase [Bacteroidales bacterium]|nr:isoprenyl transferase [Bacteroidales bacterium]HOC47219.1 isoprenyl transferase [Bacteroidales bacterium]HPS97974.1 isoprenyl transferase [Bacteroidales bacterium]